MNNSATRAAASAPPAPQSAASRLADRSGVRACRLSSSTADGHNDSPDHKRPRPGETEKQRDSEIANKMIELPAQLGAGSPFGRAKGGDHQQGHDAGCKLLRQPETETFH